MLKKYIGLLLLGSTPLFAGEVETTAELSQGYRRDYLDFSVAGPHGKPNIISELKFTKMDIYTTMLALKMTKDDYYLKGIAGYGNILNGKVKDSDYIKDCRHGEFSRSHHNITGDYTADFAITLGKKFPFEHGFELAPHVGYGAYLQRLRFKHGSHTFFNPFNGKKIVKTHHVHGLNSTYKVTWYGPQIGLDLKKSLTKTINLFANYSFLFPLKYHAEGHWNLREHYGRHFKDNSDATRSYGHIAMFGAEWDITDEWYMSLEFDLMRFYAKGGHASWGSHRQPFHKAHRRAEEIRLSVGYNF